MSPELHQIILNFQSPAIWAVGFGFGEKRRKAQEDARRNWEIANRQTDDPERPISEAERENWRRWAEQAERNAEVYRLEALKWQDELLAIKNYCRQNAPQVLPLVPNVSAFDPRPADLQALANKMVEVEAALLAAQSAAKERATDKAPVASGELATVLAQVKTFAADETGKIIEIANSDLTADEKMRRICEVDAVYYQHNSPKWAELLGVDAAAIRQTPFWKEDRKRFIASAREIFAAEHPGDALPPWLNS